MNLRGKYGFLLNPKGTAKFISASGIGHAKVALQIVESDPRWATSTYSAQDFVIKVMGALQIGGGGTVNNCLVLYSGEIYSKAEIISLALKYGVKTGYKHLGI